MGHRHNFDVPPKSPQISRANVPTSWLIGEVSHGCTTLAAGD